MLLNRVTSHNCNMSYSEQLINNKKAHGHKAQPLKDFILGSSPSVHIKLLTHILTNVHTHPPTHTQTSKLGSYNKLSLWLSLKIQILS